MRGRGEEEVVLGVSLSGLVYIHKSQAKESTEYTLCTYDIVARLSCTESESTVRGNYSTGVTRRRQVWLEGM